MTSSENKNSNNIGTYYPKSLDSNTICELIAETFGVDLSPDEMAAIVLYTREIERVHGIKEVK